MDQIVIGLITVGGVCLIIGQALLQRSIEREARATRQRISDLIALHLYPPVTATLEQTDAEVFVETPGGGIEDP